MKKLIYILGCVLGLGLYSCDALDLSPEDYYGSGNFWNKKSQVEGYILGLHQQLRSSYNMFFVMGERRGGTMRNSTSCLGTSLSYSSPIGTNLLTANNTGITSWNGLYSNILQVNHFIDQVENGCDFMTADEKAPYLGTAYGLRALYYFMLYRTYGGVPLIKDVKVLSGEKPSPEALYTARSTPEEIMTFIKEDIKKSEDYYGNNDAISTDKSMWSKQATLILKAEIYLWSAKVTTYDHKAAGNSDLKIAKTALSPIIGKYTLLKDFSQVFSEEDNNEIIFQLRFKENEFTDGGMGTFIYYTNLFQGQRYGRDGKVMGDTLQIQGVGQFLHEYKKALWDTYDADDSRRDKTFMDHYANEQLEGFGLAMKKAIGSINNNGVRIWDTDYPVYRYADALLMMAEIENGLGNPCASYINEVRKRAYRDKWGTQYEYQEGTFAENELAILHERDKEFVWEGKRWFDVVRMKDANGESLAFSADANYPDNETPTIKTPLIKKEEAYKLLWPVDVNTLNNDDKLLQTPGYGGNEAQW